MHKFRARAAIAWLMLLLSVAVSPADTLLQSFTIKEVFGVSHPDQILEFDLNSPVDPAICYMLGPGDAEVAFQVLSGNRVAVRTDLPAGTTKTWNLFSGRAPSATTPDAVQVNQSVGIYEFVNGVAGVRVINPGANISVSLAPIQGIRLRDGRWTATGPNKLYNFGKFDHTVMVATNVTVKIIESGPLRVVAELEYSFDRPEWNIASYSQILNVDQAADTMTISSGHLLDRTYIEGKPVKFFRFDNGQLPAPLRDNVYYYATATSSNTFRLSTTPNGPPVDLTSAGTLASSSVLVSRVIPRGRGTYKSTIQLDAGQPSILIEEDTDINIKYFLNTYPEVQANQGRYRGHSSTSVAMGYEADGRQYRPAHQRSGVDAFRDFQYGTPVLWELYGSSTANFPVMVAWNPWASDTGWYWMLYNKNAADNAPVVGAFVGKASRALGCIAIGPSPYTAPGNAAVLPPDVRGQTHGGLMFQASLGNPDGRVFGRSRMAWGIFVGTKGGDLNDPYQVQNIGRQMNLHGGVSLNKIFHYALEFPDPPSGYGRMFMEPEILQGMIARLRQDQSGPYGGGYHQYLYSAEPTARSLVALWKDSTGQKCQEVVSNITALASNILNDFVNGNGIYGTYQYWAGGVAMSGMGLSIDSVLAHSASSPNDRALAKAAAAMFANLLWDHDFVPLNFGENALNAGTANMPVQMQSYANSYTLLLPEHPLLKPRLNEVMTNIVLVTREIINPYGAEIGAPAYLGASLGPALNTLLQVRTFGQFDPFASEPKLAKFAEFYMHLMTPAEVRFGARRKVIASGDGATFGPYLPGVIATGFRTANPNLSARLMGAWNQAGKTHNGFLVSTLVQIDESAPALDPMLKDGNFPGYMSVLRNNWGGVNETAAWLFNGDFHSDHRNDDRGSLVLYALGAPLSINWGSIYYPAAPGASMKNMVLPESAFPNWNRSDQPINVWVEWTTSTSDRFASFQSSSLANAKMTHKSGLLWTRTLFSLHPNENMPVTLVRDEFSGPTATAGKVVSFNLTATGPVTTPSGAINPPQRTYEYAGTTKELPSASPAFSLRPGINKLSFTGQTWNAHPSRGIDWDVYSVSTETLSGNIGNWAHVFALIQEQSEFAGANGRPFEERQHVLRLRGTGTFRTLILPFRKGERPSDLQVTANGTQITIRTGDQLMQIDDHSYVYTNLQKRVLTTFSTNSASAFGFTLAGGPTELVLDHNRAFVTSHGVRARRVLNCPPEWTAARTAGQNLPATVSLVPINIDYQSDQPQTIILE